MTVDLNEVLLNGCEAATGWTNINGTMGTSDNGQFNLAVSDAYTAQEGTNCLEFGISANTTPKEGLICPAFTAFDFTLWEVGFWFLNPKATPQGDSPIMSTVTDAFQIRIYSSANDNQYAEYDWGGDNQMIGGWNYIRFGDSQPNRVGSGGAPNYNAITRIGFVILNVNANNDKQDNGDAYYAMDFFHRYQKIVVTDGTEVAPIETGDIMSIVDTKPFYGVVKKTESYHEMRCALEIGNGSASTFFRAEKEQFFFNPIDSNRPYEIRVKNNAELKFGKKVTGSGGAVYAQDGCKVLHAIKGVADIVIEAGGVLKFYASQFRNWDNLDLGGNGAGLIEFIRSDLFENVSTLFKSTGVEVSNIRMHFLEGNEAPIGQVLQVPTKLFQVKVFQCTDGLEFRVSATAEQYEAGDNTSDILILEGETVTMIDSKFSLAAGKLKRTT